MTEETKKIAPAKNDIDESVAEEKIDEKTPAFKGKFINAIGRRKTSVAQIRIFKNGKGAMMINGRKPSQYFSSDKIVIVNQPLKLTGLQRDLDISILVKGGGKRGQADAIRHGISRALIKYDESLTESLKAKGYLTRDSRKIERKKPGLKKARKAPQWSKR